MRYSKYLRLIYDLGDVSAITLSVIVVLSLQPTLNTFNYFLLFVSASTIGWFLCTNLLGISTLIRVTRRLYIIFDLLKVLLLYVILFEAGLNITNTTAFTRTSLIYHYLSLAFFIISIRLILITLLRIYRSKGYNLRKFVIVGHNETAKQLKQFLSGHPEFGYKFLGYFSNTSPSKRDYIGGVCDIEKFVLEHDIHEIYCCQCDLSTFDFKKLIRFADNNFIRIRILPELNAFALQNQKIDFYDMLPIIMIRNLPLDDAVNRVIKRSFDVVFSSIVIVFILSWLLPVLAILIKVNSKGPVLFKQTRSGINNKSFKCYKLRTMYVNTDSHTKLVSRGDSRITPIGAFLRKSSLDELPQFFNVLFGHMSIVGPRPHMLKADEEYAVIAEKYKVRHFVKPGITGLSQVRGYRGDTSYAYQVRGRVRLDIFYLENWSFYLDMVIIYYTIYNVIRGDKHAF